jgi:hypothetical protein
MLVRRTFPVKVLWQESSLLNSRSLENNQYSQLEDSYKETVGRRGWRSKNHTRLPHHFVRNGTISSFSLKQMLSILGIQQFIHTTVNEGPWRICP